MAGQNIDLFDAYFRRADLDRDGRISGNEAVAFFQGSNLAKPVLAQIWMHADQHKTGFLGRAEFYNALKLVTVAQSKRELTPDIVKAALYGPASAKIPAPQINVSSAPDPPSNPTAGTAGPQLSGGALSPSHNMGVRAPQLSSNTSMGSQFIPLQQNHIGRPPLPTSASTAFRPQQVVGSRLPGMSATAASQALGTNISTDWLGGMTSGSPAGVITQAPNRGITPLTTSAHPMPNANYGLVQPAAPKPNDSIFPPSHMGGKDSKPAAVSGNGFTSDSVFGDVFSVTSSQAKQDAPLAVSSSGNLPVTPAMVPASADLQSAVNSSSLGSLQSAFSQQPVGGQNQKILSTVKENQQIQVQNSTEFNFSSAGFAAGYPLAGQSQIPWPRMTQSDVQKYTKVFVEVDTDRDGRITGEQARNLFLSWRLPREILKQVWDLSDQDNDSMLSFREFCIALYLMERNREGRSLPKTLQSSMFDETLFSSGQPAAAYGNASWRPTPGLQQTRVMPGAPPATLVARGRPPKPVPVPLADEHIHPTQQKSKVPILEKRLINQLSEEEQSLLNLKFQDATESNKKVEDLEKDILDSREKTEFYRSKMQELILYKSRCDNRLNEIIERISADKREAELLAKKYEEKYKQIGDVASKLPIEEATFRDIQDKKMELYRAIVKMGQDGKPENIQVNANQIQSELEELVKFLNERCKSYGLRAKPTTLVELPFGWQPGLQAGAADWDESWDKFEDEGFTFVKEFTLDVQNVVAPPKPKSSLVVDKSSSTKEGVDVSSTNANRASETLLNECERVHVDAHDEDEIARSPPESPTHNVDSPSHKSQNSPANKELDSNKHSGSALFDGGDLDLPPIRTDSSHQRKSPFPFADSVPSTPLFSSGNTVQADNKTFVFDSVPSTPQGDNLFQKKNTFAFDSFPSTPQSDNLFQHKSVFAFDSVPSTPVYNYEENAFDKFSRFDSFNESHGSLSRFDSMRSTTEGFFPPQQDSFARFDSFRSTAGGSEINTQGFFQNKDYARFDSIRSNADDTHGFQSFDDADPFGSSGQFKTSSESQTPRRVSDNWRAF